MLNEEQIFSSFEISSLFQFREMRHTTYTKYYTITFVYYKLRVVWGSYRKKLTNASMLVITINFDQFRIFIFSLLFILEVIPMRKLRRIAHCMYVIFWNIREVTEHFALKRWDERTYISWCFVLLDMNAYYIYNGRKKKKKTRKKIDQQNI